RGRCQPNDIRIGRDGRMYVCVGIADSSGYMDENMIPFVLKAPDGHPTPAKDIVLPGFCIAQTCIMESSVPSFHCSTIQRCANHH
ncbi:MAG: hypothetical protein WD426_17530, partial [Anditalea sp.]